MVQVLEVVGDPPGGVEVEASFDEFNLDVRIRYAGTPLTIPERRPTPQEIVASEDGERLTVSSEMFCAVREISRQSPGIKLFNVGFDPGNGGC